MFKDWDKGFDMVCGAAITDETSEPVADSGLWDLLHGRKDALEEDESTRSRTKPRSTPSLVRDKRWE